MQIHLAYYINPLLIHFKLCGWEHNKLCILEILDPNPNH